MKELRWQPLMRKQIDVHASATFFNDKTVKKGQTKIRHFSYLYSPFGPNDVFSVDAIALAAMI